MVHVYSVAGMEKILKTLFSNAAYLPFKYYFSDEKLRSWPWSRNQICGFFWALPQSYLSFSEEWNSKTCSWNIFMLSKVSIMLEKKIKICKSHLKIPERVTKLRNSLEMASKGPWSNDGFKIGISQSVVLDQEHQHHLEISEMQGLTLIWDPKGGALKVEPSNLKSPLGS
jgi:hypothetical protein